MVCNKQSSKRSKKWSIANIYKAVIILVFVTIFCPPSIAEPLSYTDTHIKAAYTLKIKEFVKWPDNEAVFQICVVGSDLIGSSLAQIQSSSDRKEKIKIEKKSGNSSFNDCQIVYISAMEQEQMEQVLFSLAGLPILTISDIEDFVYKGGIIEFVEIERKIKMNINLANAKNNGLSISSKLLQVANKVVKSN